MLRTILKSKIHSATVTEANLAYVGSVTIDAALLQAADILVHEKVQIVNVNNGARIETYCIPAEAGSGVVCMNGAAARWAAPGDRVIIISYGHADTEEARRHQPKMIFVDEANRITEQRLGYA
ncbi:MAG: aspartate 1-decarboxylase [Candidatus Omnitrophica bacterium]|nr:aspartate 1-decarboxylase [Candidatus Omnitrophota bacterium]